MKCHSCGSTRQRIFGGEIALHFPGIDGLTKPIVWSFPNVTVCLECGSAEFAVPKDPLEVLRNTDAATGGPRSMSA
jgi:hypothetical protein